MADFQKVTTLSELKEGEVKGVKVNGQQIALYRLGDQVFGTTDICAHEQCVISENYYVEGEEVECTCHGSRYEIRTGKNTVPPASEPLTIFLVKVEGQDVLVQI